MINAHIHIYVYIYTHIPTYTQKHTYIHTRTRTHTLTHTHTHIYIRTTYIHNIYRKKYVVKHILMTEVYLMSMRWKQIHFSAYIGHHVPR